METAREQLTAREEKARLPYAGHRWLQPVSHQISQPGQEKLAGEGKGAAKRNKHVLTPAPTPCVRDPKSLVSLKALSGT